MSHGLIKSRAKNLVIELVKTPLDQTFSFTCPKGASQGLVHRMRVELSRFRAQVKVAGKQPKPFTVQVVSVMDEEMIAGVQMEKVTLVRTQSPSQKTQELLPQLIAGA